MIITVTSRARPSIFVELNITLLYKNAATGDRHRYEWHTCCKRYFSNKSAMSFPCTESLIRIYTYSKFSHLFVIYYSRCNIRNNALKSDKWIFLDKRKDKNFLSRSDFSIKSEIWERKREREREKWSRNGNLLEKFSTSRLSQSSYPPFPLAKLFRKRAAYPPRSSVISTFPFGYWKTKKLEILK